MLYEAIRRGKRRRDVAQSSLSGWFVRGGLLYGTRHPHGDVSAAHATRHARSPRFARGPSPRARAATPELTSEAVPGTRRNPFVAVRAQRRASPLRPLRDGHVAPSFT